MCLPDPGEGGVVAVNLEVEAVDGLAAVLVVVVAEGDKPQTRRLPREHGNVPVVGRQARVGVRVARRRVVHRPEEHL